MVLQFSDFDVDRRQLLVYISVLYYLDKVVKAKGLLQKLYDLMQIPGCFSQSLSDISGCKDYPLPWT
jgi:hypothetical protein